MKLRKRLVESVVANCEAFVRGYRREQAYRDDAYRDDEVTSPGGEDYDELIASEDWPAIMHAQIAKLLELQAAHNALGGQLLTARNAGHAAGVRETEERMAKKFADDAAEAYRQGKAGGSARRCRNLDCGATRWGSGRCLFCGVENP